MGLKGVLGGGALLVCRKYNLMVVFKGVGEEMYSFDGIGDSCLFQGGSGRNEEKSCLNKVVRIHA